MEDAQDAADDGFQSALFGEDELGVVVRAHIHVEAILLNLLELLMTDPKHLEKMDLDFAQRVHLAVALGLKEEYASPLLALNTIRNAFAHTLSATISENRVSSLYNALSGAAKSKVQSAYERTKKEIRADMPAFSKLAPKSRFILIAVVLRSVLRLAVIEAKQADK